MMTKRVLIIDDDLDVCKQIKYSLQDNTTEVYYSVSVYDAMERFLKQQFTLVIMDIDLSETNGMSLLRMLHQQNPVPILVLTANVSKEEEIKALEAGADKYLGKPLDIEKCLAHAQAIMRRHMIGIDPSRAYILAAGNGLEIDVRSRRAFLIGQELDLPRKQFEMLCVLAAHLGDVVTKTEMYQEIWRDQYDLNADEALKSQVKKLRQKLGANGGVGLIETIWGVGYRLNE